MDRKLLTFDPHLCTGCMYCMTACSTYNEGSTSLSRARLHIIRHEGHAVTKIGEEDELVFALIGCQQCEEPLCAILCPHSALKQDPSTGAIVILKDRCVGCHTCLTNCPFGAISFNEQKQQVFKCELCKGDPQCVKFCQPGALRFEPAKDVAPARRGKAAAKIIEGMERDKVVGGGA